jgi:hypothetical protein
MLWLERPSVRTLLLSWAYRNGLNCPLRLALNNSTPEVCKKIHFKNVWLLASLDSRDTTSTRHQAWATADSSLVHGDRCGAPGHLSGAILPLHHARGAAACLPISTATHHSPSSFPHRRDVVYSDYSGVMFSTAPSRSPSATSSLSTTPERRLLAIAVLHQVAHGCRRCCVSSVSGVFRCMFQVFHLDVAYVAIAIYACCKRKCFECFKCMF